MTGQFRFSLVNLWNSFLSFSLLLAYFGGFGVYGLDVSLGLSERFPYFHCSAKLGCDTTKGLFRTRKALAVIAFLWLFPLNSQKIRENATFSCTIFERKN